MTVELRDIEIFLTLAQELHFGRTAERLHVSQARVSQAIKQQELRIGAALFERTSRRVTLTAVGEQLYADLKVGYRRIVEGVEAATAVARGERGRLVLGVIGPLTQEITPTTDLFRARHPDCELVWREIVFSNPFGPLRGGQVDVALVWFPVCEPDLTVGPTMITMPMVLAASVRHPLAVRGRVCMEDLGDHPIIQSEPAIPDYWEEMALPHRTPSGRPIVRGPSVGTWQEILTVVSAGEAVCSVGAMAIKYNSRPDIAYLPIEDGPVLPAGIIWRSNDDRALVRSFADIARTQETVDLAYLIAPSRLGGPDRGSLP